MLPLPPSRRPDRPLFPSYFRNCSKAAFACFRPRLGTGGEAVNEPLALRCRTAPDKLVGKRAGTAILRAFPQVPANRRHNRVSERNLCRCAPCSPPTCLQSLRAADLPLPPPCDFGARWTPLGHHLGPGGGGRRGMWRPRDFPWIGMIGNRISQLGGHRRAARFRRQGARGHLIAA